jgi:hypothetical protein
MLSDRYSLDPRLNLTNSLTIYCLPPLIESSFPATIVSLYCEQRFRRLDLLSELCSAEKVNFSWPIKAQVLAILLLSLSTFFIAISLLKPPPAPYISRTKHTRTTRRSRDLLRPFNKRNPALNMVSKKSSTAAQRGVEKAPIFNITNGPIFGNQCYGRSEGRFSVRGNQYTTTKAFDCDGGQSTPFLPCLLDRTRS